MFRKVHAGFLLRMQRKLYIVGRWWIAAPVLLAPALMLDRCSMQSTQLSLLSADAPSSHSTPHQSP